MLTATTGPDGRRPNAPVSASVTIRATPIAARAAMNAPKMRSKVVSAMRAAAARGARGRCSAVASATTPRSASPRSAPGCRRSRRTRRTRIRRRPSAGAPAAAAPARRHRTGAALIRARRSPADGRGTQHRAGRRGEDLMARGLRLLERGAMRVAAEHAAASRQRLVARQVHAAMRAREHRLRRLRRSARRRRGAGRHRAAQQPEQHEDGDENRAGSSWAQAEGGAVQHHLEHEARADVGEQQQGGAGVDAARRLSARASRRRADRRAGRRRRASRGSRTPSCGPSARGR